MKNVRSRVLRLDTAGDRVRPAAVAFAWSLALLGVSCSPEQVVPNCARFDVGSMGPENNFHVLVDSPDAPTLRKAFDRIDVALSVVRPPRDSVVLVHTPPGRPSTRWTLEFPAASGISTRCRLGTTSALSTCGATLGVLPRSLEGNWSLETTDGHVLEAAVAVLTCP